MTGLRVPSSHFSKSGITLQSLTPTSSSRRTEEHIGKYHEIALRPLSACLALRTSRLVLLAPTPRGRIDRGWSIGLRPHLTLARRQRGSHGSKLPAARYSSCRTYLASSAIPSTYPRLGSGRIRRGRLGPMSWKRN